jgi:hypothetical protein
MAMWLMKSGKSEDAVKLMQKACNECWDSETRFNLELALVEVLICLVHNFLLLENSVIDLLHLPTLT